MLRRSLRTQITTRVVALSAAAALVLGASLIVLIVAVTGQRDAARTAFRSQQALSVADQLEKSLLSIENGLNRYVSTKRPSFLVPVRRELALYPSRTQRLAALVSDDPGQQSRVRALAVQIKDYDDFWVQSLIEIAREKGGERREDGFVKARSQIETDGGRSRLDAIRTRFARLFDRERAVIRARESKAESRSSRAIGFGLGGLGLLVAVSVGFTLYLRRSVLRPVRTVAEATGRLAAGDLTTRVPAQREDELGELARGFNTMADSLERGRDELERSNAELSRSNAELEQFASVTSHDLQAPLTTISMYAELLDRRRGGSAGNGGNGDLDLVDGIRDATQQARGLIRDLLEYSRAGRGRLALEQVPAGRIVDQALEALAGHDRGERRADHRRRAAGRAGRPREPLPRLSEPRRQRGEVHRRGDSPREHRRRARGRPLALLGPRQRNRHESQATQSASSSPSSACTARRPTPAPASAWPSASGSSISTAGASGSPAGPARAASFTSPCRRRCRPAPIRRPCKAGV